MKSTEQIEFENAISQFNKDASINYWLILAPLALAFWSPLWGVMIALAYLCYLLIEINRSLRINGVGTSILLNSILRKE